eukprot:11639425-Alexandrium_andersonii.AAC.1
MAPPPKCTRPARRPATGQPGSDETSPAQSPGPVPRQVQRPARGLQPRRPQGLTWVAGLCATAPA